MGNKLLIISLSYIHRDPRVLRQIDFLKNDYHLTVAGLSDPEIEGVDFILFPGKPANGIFTKVWDLLLATFGFFDYLFWKQKNIIALRSILNELAHKPDVILSNDVQVLPLSSCLAKKWKSLLVADLHEYAPLELEDVLIWKLRYQRYYYHLLKKYLPTADHITTVCKSIQQKLAEEFKVTSSILSNAPAFENLQAAAVREDRIRIIHHGGAMRSRHIELMIEMLRYLDKRFELYLMLIDTDPGYLDELKQMSLNNSNIHFLNPVPTVQIASFINQFDIGLFLLPPVNFNYKIALPNKFFEFIQARLCTAIGPSIEMVSLTQQFNTGVVASDFSAKSLADELNQLTASQILAFKNNSAMAASELSAGKNKSLLLSILKKS